MPRGRDRERASGIFRFVLRACTSAADPRNKASRQPPVVKVQGSDAEIRIQQLEDQMRQLNGRIEEMSYQLLQMQETIRKTQEDNEFRFQQLEKSGGGAGGGAGNAVAATPGAKKSEADVARPRRRPVRQHDDIADGHRSPQEPKRLLHRRAGQNGGLGQPPTGARLDRFRSERQSGRRNRRRRMPQSVPRRCCPMPPQRRSRPPRSAAKPTNTRRPMATCCSGDYGTAEQEFTRYITRYPNSARAADANFWLGEALYSQGKYNDAGQSLY